MFWAAWKSFRLLEQCVASGVLHFSISIHFFFIMIILPAGHEHDFQVKWEHPNVGESEERGKQPQHRLTLTDKLRPGGEKANKVCVCVGARHLL